MPPFVRISPFAPRISVRVGLALILCGFRMTHADSASLFLFPETLECPEARIPGFDAWVEYPHGTLPGLSMGQGWTEASPQQRGEVRLLRSGNDLWVKGVLPDRDIFNPVTEFNREAWSRGDVFEIFLRPEGQERYFEFHVTPGNQRYQLRFDPEGVDAEGNSVFRKELSTLPVESRVEVRLEENRWVVYVRIPLADLIAPAGRPVPKEWKMSFCRYDYTRTDGEASAELFSTSPHRKLSFHRRHEWTSVTFR